MVMSNMVILLKRILKRIICWVRYKGNERGFEAIYKKISSDSPSLSSVKDKDKKFRAWTDKWSVFGVKPSKRGYKVFSRFIKGDEMIDYVPEAISRSFIEPVLTPEEFSPFYSDKNSFDLLLPDGYLPKTFLRSIDGKLMDGKYRAIRLHEWEFSGFLHEKAVDEVAVKPSRGTWGKGFALFRWKNGSWINSGGDVLTLPYLWQHYGKNWMIQECLHQCDFMAQFNSTSVNTIRIACYRSVRTGELVTLNAVMRMGGKGAVVDNVSAGGMFVEIKDDGTLGKKVFNNYGKESAVHNGIDFSANEFKIPHYERVKEFVISIAMRMPHMSLFANDVMIDENGTPRLVEVNTQGFLVRFYHFCSHPAFGKYTDEIIEFCKEEYKTLNSRMTLLLPTDKISDISA